MAGLVASEDYRQLQTAQEVGEVYSAILKLCKTSCELFWINTYKRASLKAPQQCQINDWTSAESIEES